MKYLLTLWPLGLMLLLITHSKAENGITLAQDLLKESFNYVIENPDKIYAQECKNLSEQILKDSKIKEASHKVLRNFKQNITNYLALYPTYKQFGLYHELVIMFENIVQRFYPEPSNESNTQYINKILKKLGYPDINSKYEKEFLKFIQKKLANKFHKFAKKLPKSDIELRHTLTEWSDYAKLCKDYECALEEYNALYDILYTAKDETIDQISDELDKINLIYLKEAYNMSKLILQDPQLTQLNTKLQRNLTLDINDFLKKYNNSQKLENIYETFHRNISQKYYNNINKISSKDHELLKTIFEENGFSKMQNNHDKLLKNFIKNDLPEIMENFESTVMEEALKKEEDLLDWYDNIKTLKTHDQRLEAFSELNDFK